MSLLHNCHFTRHQTCEF